MNAGVILRREDAEESVDSCAAPVGYGSFAVFAAQDDTEWGVNE